MSMTGTSARDALDAKENVWYSPSWPGCCESDSGCPVVHFRAEGAMYDLPAILEVFHGWSEPVTAFAGPDCVAAQTCSYAICCAEKFVVRTGHSAGKLHVQENE